MKIHASLAALGLLASTAMAAPQNWGSSPLSPLSPPDLYWAEPDYPAPPQSEFTLAGQGQFDYGTLGFCYLEVRATVGMHAECTWIYFATCVRFDASFDTDTEIPSAYRHEFLKNPPSYDFSNGVHPSVVVSEPRFLALMDAVDDPVFVNDEWVFEAVEDYFQPIRPDPGGISECRWDADYPNWPASDYATYWKRMDVPQTGQILDLEDLLVGTIESQTNGQVDGADFFFNYGSRCATLHGMQLEIQPIFVHGTSDPDFDDGSTPTGPKGTFLGVGTTTPLIYIFYPGYLNDRDGKNYPTNSGLQSSVTFSFQANGAFYPIDANWITAPAWARVESRIGGGAPIASTWQISKAEGGPLAIWVPEMVPDGTIVEVVGFDVTVGNGLTSLVDIPVADRDHFVIVE